MPLVKYLRRHPLFVITCLLSAIASGSLRSFSMMMADQTPPCLFQDGLCLIDHADGDDENEDEGGDAGGSSVIIPLTGSMIVSGQGVVTAT